MSTFFAQPYDISARGFFFETAEVFEERVASATNRYGLPVEEFEIQFIDGEMIDAALAEALDVHQGNIADYFECEAAWSDHQKRAVIIAIGECGYGFDLATGDPDDFDIDIYAVGSLRELAEQFVDEGLFGDIPAHLAHYIDYDAIARDLACDYAETCIAGMRLVYRCG